MGSTADVSSPRPRSPPWASWKQTGAGQHGVAAATVCARFGFECVVYMGSEDMRRQRPNVERMRLLGAEVRPVEFGTRTLKEATSEAIRDWITNVETTYYLIGSCVGGGSNAIGLFAGFLEDADVRLVGVEAEGAASLSNGRTAVLHGARS